MALAFAAIARNAEESVVKRFQSVPQSDLLLIYLASHYP